MAGAEAAAATRPTGDGTDHMMVPHLEDPSRCRPISLHRAPGGREKAIEPAVEPPVAAAAADAAGVDADADAGATHWRPMRCQQWGAVCKGKEMGGGYGVWCGVVMCCVVVCRHLT